MEEIRVRLRRIELSVALLMLGVSVIIALLLAH